MLRGTSIANMLLYLVICVLGLAGAADADRPDLNKIKKQRVSDARPVTSRVVGTLPDKKTIKEALADKIHLYRPAPEWCKNFKITQVGFTRIKDGYDVPLHLIAQGPNGEYKEVVFRNLPSRARRARGQRSHEIARARIRFGSRGFQNGWTINIAQNFHYLSDDLWLHVAGCERNPGSGFVIRKPFQYGDLGFTHNHQNEYSVGGTEGTFRTKFKNYGPSRSRLAYVVWTVDGSVVKRQQVKIRNPGWEGYISWRYNRTRYSGKKVVISFTPESDPVFPANNKTEPYPTLK